MTGINPRPGDGRISRAEAALLAGVDDDTISAWISRHKFKDVRREGRRVWLDPREVIEVEHEVHKRERARDQRRRERMDMLLGVLDDDEAVA